MFGHATFHPQLPAKSPLSKDHLGGIYHRPTTHLVGSMARSRGVARPSDASDRRDGPRQVYGHIGETYGASDFDKEALRARSRLRAFAQFARGREGVHSLMDVSGFLAVPVFMLVSFVKCLSVCLIAGPETRNSVASGWQRTRTHKRHPLSSKACPLPLARSSREPVVQELRDGVCPKVITNRQTKHITQLTNMRKGERNRPLRNPET